MTKKKVTTKVDPSEQFIVASGSHSRKEAGVTCKYEAGDMIVLSAAELEEFPSRFMSLADYGAMVAADKRRRAEERARRRKMLPPDKARKANRDPEAIRRQKNLLKLTRKSERRILMS